MTIIRKNRDKKLDFLKKFKLFSQKWENFITSWTYINREIGQSLLWITFIRNVMKESKNNAK